MGRIGSFSTADMRNLQRQLDKIRQGDIEAFVDSCAKELAARLLAEAIKRTPVGEYSGGEYQCKVKKGPKPNHVSWKVKGKKGGTLRRGWTAQRSGSGSEGLNTRGAKQYAETLQVHHFGNMIVIEIINPVEYASYVEYGHRKPNGKGWVRGHFMLTISEREIQKIAPQVLERKIRKFLGECLK